MQFQTQAEVCSCVSVCPSVCVNGHAHGYYVHCGRIVTKGNRVITVTRTLVYQPVQLHHVWAYFCLIFFQAIPCTSTLWLNQWLNTIEWKHWEWEGEVGVENKFSYWPRWPSDYGLIFPFEADLKHWPGQNVERTKFFTFRHSWFDTVKIRTISHAFRHISTWC